jgi:hypothetical protein
MFAFLPNLPKRLSCPVGHLGPSLISNHSKRVTTWHALSGPADLVRGSSSQPCVDLCECCEGCENAEKKLCVEVTTFDTRQQDFGTSARRDERETDSTWRTWPVLGIRCLHQTGDSPDVPRDVPKPPSTGRPTAPQASQADSAKSARSGWRQSACGWNLGGLPEPAVGVFTPAGTCPGRLRRHFVIQGRVVKGWVVRSTKTTSRRGGGRWTPGIVVDDGPLTHNPEVAGSNPAPATRGHRHSSAGFIPTELWR